MGRYSKKITKLMTISLAAFALSSPGTVLPLQAEASANAAQIYPAISVNTPLARDEETFENDRTLDAECRKSGQNSAVCLCVTHILKYELTLSEYQVVTRIYGQPQDRTRLYQRLKNEGFKASEIGIAEEMERSLTQDKDFALRCSEAKAYYKTVRN